MPPHDEVPCPGGMKPACEGLLTFDYESAEREGWTIAQFDCHADGTPIVVVLRLAAAETLQGGFSSDTDARRHVAERAAEGSLLHCQAMALLDRYERFVASALHGAAEE